MASENMYLGIDFGGTAVKLGLVHGSGALAGKSSLVTGKLEDEISCSSFARSIAEFVHESGVSSAELDGVAMAVPGIVADGIGHTPNVNVDWALVLKHLQDAFPGKGIRILNDANAAALGELWMGAGQGADSVLLVTLGTGVGSGFVVGGNIVAGGHGAAGEVGHLTVVPGGRPCKCGRVGCLEQYASASGVVQTYRECCAAGIEEGGRPSFVPKHDSDTLTIYRAALANDPYAKEAFAVMADKLGFALAQVACVVDPAVILLGGGLSAGYEAYLDDLRESFRSYSLDACAQTPIRCASLLGDAGIFGAARYAMQ